jgi:hypothetical protein
MRSLILAVCAAAVLLLPLRAAAQAAAHTDSPRVTITVVNPMLVGDTLVTPGEYRFQCRHVDGRTFLVVTASHSHKEVARVPCEQEVLPDKVANSELRSVIAAEGMRTLQSVRIKGEFVAHRIAN